MAFKIEAVIKTIIRNTIGLPSRQMRAFEEELRKAPIGARVEDLPPHLKIYRGTTLDRRSKPKESSRG